uniref:hypothetical protein n=1 Tax=Aeromonas hydrophila TaxID=644 RepID=UPI002B493D36
MGILGASNHIAREIKLTFPYLYQHCFQQGKVIQLGYETVGTGLQTTHHMYGDGIHLTVAHKREWSYGFKPDNKT